jgi:hypothetical protein
MAYGTNGTVGILSKYLDGYIEFTHFIAFGLRANRVNRPYRLLRRVLNMLLENKNRGDFIASCIGHK